MENEWTSETAKAGGGEEGQNMKIPADSSKQLWLLRTSLVGEGDMHGHSAGSMPSGLKGSQRGMGIWKCTPAVQGCGCPWMDCRDF